MTARDESDSKDLTDQLPPFMTPEQLAELLALPNVDAVYKLNHRRSGPTVTRVGKLVRYARADVEAWLRQQREPAKPSPEPLGRLRSA